MGRPRREDRSSRIVGTRDKAFLTPVIDQVFRLALLGATLMEMAAFFDIGLSTLNRWLDVSPEFKLAVQRGREVADANVAERLYARALGYEYDETQVTNGTDGLGREYSQTKIIKKHVPPDVRAITYWLNNRQRTHWGDTQRIEFEGELKFTAETTLQLKKLNPEQRALLKSIALKQIEESQRHNKPIEDAQDIDFTEA